MASCAFWNNSQRACVLCVHRWSVSNIVILPLDDAPPPSVDASSGAARGGWVEASPPYGWTSRHLTLCNYVCAFIVMELLRITRQIHCKAVEQRATLIHRQYNRDWGTSYSRPPIDPYLTPPPLKILAAPLDANADNNVRRSVVGVGKSAGDKKIKRTLFVYWRTWSGVFPRPRAHSILRIFAKPCTILCI